MFGLGLDQIIPFGMNKTCFRFVHSLIGVGAEEIALSLGEVLWQICAAVSIVIGQACA